MNFEIISKISEVKIIAVGRIHDLARLRKMYGNGRWRKLKGVATIRLASDTALVARKSNVKATLTKA